MGKPKAAAKAAAQTTRARPEWPRLGDRTAKELFASVEHGCTVEQASERCGLKWATVAQWKRRYPAFRDRLELALESGKQLRQEPSKPERLLPEHLLVPVESGDWPTNLDDKVAESLFDAIECGEPPSVAAEALGLKPNLVWKWRARHKKFAERMQEAVDIGIRVQIDQNVPLSDTAMDRDSAAAAKERREGRKAYREAHRPDQFRTTPFNPNAIQINVGVNFEQELLAARQRAFADRGLITVSTSDEPKNG